MSLNLSAPILAAIKADSSITSLLGVYNDEPSIHTRRPVPAEAGSPLITISPDITITDEDGISDRRPVVRRDVAVYGDAIGHYRVVEELGYLLRELFHRQHQILTVPGYSVVDVRVAGPMIAPASDDTMVGRLVTLTIRLASSS